MISPSYFNKFFFSLLLLLLCYLGCFIFTSHSKKNHPNPDDLRRKRKSPNHLPLSLSSSWALLKRVFSTTPKRDSKTSTVQCSTTLFPPPRSSRHSVHIPILGPEAVCVTIRVHRFKPHFTPEQ
uniref:Uncharacterized protein n=1 Tax=Opuntia streptacantha TaxID=393608 RepID=A0A7C9AJA4_OPUST